jgi:hypothetical protein
MQLLLALLLFAQHHPIGAQIDDPMIRWDCDRTGHRLVLELVRPPLERVNGREVLLLGGAVNFEQCRLGGASWTLLVDLVEYDWGRCEVQPDTIISLFRDDTLVLSSVVVGDNCGDRPVLSAARISDRGKGAAPRIELCTATIYGADPHCAPLQLHRMRQAIDNEAVAVRARNGARKAR